MIPTGALANLDKPPANPNMTRQSGRGQGGEASRNVR